MVWQHYKNNYIRITIFYLHISFFYLLFFLLTYTVFPVYCLFFINSAWKTLHLPQLPGSSGNTTSLNFGAFCDNCLLIFFFMNKRLQFVRVSLFTWWNQTLQFDSHLISEPISLMDWSYFVFLDVQGETKRMLFF